MAMKTGNYNVIQSAELDEYELEKEWQDINWHYVEHSIFKLQRQIFRAEKKKETIEIKETGKLEKALNLMRTTDENDLYFKRIVFNGSKVDAYIYDTLKCSGKYDNLMSAITSGTLKKVIYDLYQKNIEKGTVNVYSNDYCFFTPN